MAQEPKWLKISEVVERLSRFAVSADRARAYADAGYLRSYRPIPTGRGHSHRLISDESVDALAKVLALPPPEQPAALDELKRRNAAQPES